MEQLDSNLTSRLISSRGDNEEGAVIVNASASDEEEIGQRGEDITNEQTWARGEKQPPRFRDAPWAVLFYLQVICIIAVAVFVPVKNESSGKDRTDEPGPSQSGLLFFSLVMAGVSFVLGAIALALMTKFSVFLIQASLFFTVGMGLCMTMVAILESNGPLAFFGFFVSAIGCCYACAVWRRIPFAAANLKAALQAVKANYGIVLIAYFLVALSVIYSALIILDVIAVYGRFSQCDDGDCEVTDSGNIILILLLLGLFWTQQVIKNTIHVSTAGTVGEWWFDATNAASFCGRAILDSFYRATTYSFGSICLGSLLVALIQTLRQIVYQARHNSRDGDNILLCIAECILSCLQDLAEYFNKWAYVYVGLYGYEYAEAGKNVMTLFKQRGWTTIITDDLVSNTLSLMCLVLSGLAGCAGVILNVISSSWLEDLGDNTAVPSFMIAFVVAMVISSILMGVVESSVNTVVVLFAETPAEGRTNHPDLIEEMLDAWKMIYPNDCGF